MSWVSNSGMNWHVLRISTFSFIRKFSENSRLKFGVSFQVLKNETHFCFKYLQSLFLYHQHLLLLPGVGHNIVNFFSFSRVNLTHHVSNHYFRFFATFFYTVEPSLLIIPFAIVLHGGMGFIILFQGILAIWPDRLNL